MAGLIFALCAATALACTCLLLRAYRRTRHRLLLWSSLCFAGLFMNNLLLLVDRVLFPQIDLSTLRLAAAALGIALLVYGLIWESE